MGKNSEEYLKERSQIEKLERKLQRIELRSIPVDELLRQVGYQTKTKNSLEDETHGKEHC